MIFQNLAVTASVIASEARHSNLHGYLLLLRNFFSKDASSASANISLASALESIKYLQYRAIPTFRSWVVCSFYICVSYGTKRAIIEGN